MYLGCEILAGDDYHSVTIFHLENLVASTNRLDPTDLRSGWVEIDAFGYVLSTGVYYLKFNN